MDIGGRTNILIIEFKGIVVPSKVTSPLLNTLESPKRASNYIISSYMPSIQSLLRDQSAVNDKFKVMVVIQPNTRTTLVVSQNTFLQLCKRKKPKKA